MEQVLGQIWGQAEPSDREIGRDNEFDRETPPYSVEGGVCVESAAAKRSPLWTLRRYLLHYVEIPTCDVSLAKRVVEDVKRSLVTFMVDSSYASGYPIRRNFDHTGSVYEGLKVIRPDEFDLMVHIKLDNEVWKCQPGNSSPGFWFVRMVKSQTGQGWHEFNNDDRCLHPRKVLQKFQSMLQRWCNINDYSELLSYSVKLVTNGPAVTIHVKYFGGKEYRELDIDIVPSVTLRGPQMYFGRGSDVILVAKSDPGDDPNPLLWRQSFSREEKEKITGLTNSQNQCLKVMKIMKAVLRNNAQLRLLSSYHLKTVLLHMVDDHRFVNWDQDELVQHFRDFIRVLNGYISERHLPNKFNPEINLLRRYSNQSLTDLNNRLSRLLKLDDENLTEQLLVRRI